MSRLLKIFFSDYWADCFYLELIQLLQRMGLAVLVRLILFCETSRLLFSKSIFVALPFNSISRLVYSIQMPPYSADQLTRSYSVGCTAWALFCNFHREISCLVIMKLILSSLSLSVRIVSLNGYWLCSFISTMVSLLFSTIAQRGFFDFYSE